MRGLAPWTLPMAVLLGMAVPSFSQSFSHRAGGDTFGVTFFGSRGFVAEDGGRIRYTDDGGNTWSQARVAASVRGQLRGIQFISSSIGYAVGDEGVLVKTVDGGVNWALHATICEPVTGDPATLHMVHFHDELDGWVMGDDMTLYRTLTGGGADTDSCGTVNGTWTQYQPLMFHNGDIYDIAFPDPTDRDTFVLAQDYGFLGRTTDGGASWGGVQIDVCSLCPAPSPSLPDCNLEFWAVDFYDANNGVAIGGAGTNNGYLYRTEDGGVTWQQENCMELICSGPTCTPTPTFYGGIATGTEDALTVGYGSSLLRRTATLTNNTPCTPCLMASGEGWEQTFAPTASTAPPHRWIAPVNATTAMATGMFGIIREVTNNGATVVEKGTEAWHRVSSGKFVDKDNGFLGAQGRVIMSVTNDGRDLVEIKAKETAPSGTVWYIEDIDVNGSNVIGVGNGAAIRTSINGGSTWLSPAAPSTTDYHGVCFTPSGSQAYAVGDNGAIEYSLNGGQTWSTLTNLGVALRDIHFLSDTVGIVVGAGKYAAWTVDAGVTWTAFTFNDAATPTLQAIDGDFTELYVAGNSGSVYRLNFGTLVFEVQALGAAATSTNLSDVAVVSSTGEVYATGAAGLVLYYDGSTWDDPKSYMGASLHSVDMFAPGSGMISGTQSGVLRVQ